MLGMGSSVSTFNRPCTPDQIARGYSSTSDGRCMKVWPSAKWEPGDGPGPSPKAPRLKDKSHKFSERKSPGLAAKKKRPTSPAAASETNWLLWGGVAVVAAFFLLRKK